MEIVKTHYRQQKNYEEALLEEKPAGYRCLYIRRDTFPDGTYEEYAYVGPEAEVSALAERSLLADMEKIDELLRTGKSFDEALKELGR